MPRANRRKPEPTRPGSRLEERERVETFAGREWRVRMLRPSDSGKSYLCPGCQQQVTAAHAHVLTWPTDGMGSLEDRRHWHTHCWAKRSGGNPGSALL